jgi:hypothetical protein
MIYRYRTKPFHRYRTKGQYTGTEPSPFRIEPKSLNQCKTKNPSPVQNQKAALPVQNQEPFAGTKPRAALLEHNQGTFTGTEPRAALLEHIQGPLTGTKPKGRSTGTEP